MPVHLFVSNSEKEALLLAQNASQKYIDATQEEQESTQILAEQITTLQASLQQLTRSCAEKDVEIKGLQHQLTTKEALSRCRHDELLQELRQTRGQLGTAQSTFNDHPSS